MKPAVFFDEIIPRTQRLSGAALKPAELSAAQRGVAVPRVHLAAVVADKDQHRFGPHGVVGVERRRDVPDRLVQRRDLLQLP